MKISKLINYIPCIDTYFFSEDKPQVKLSEEIVRRNYSIYSPFKNPEIIYFEDKNKIYIWFSRIPKKEWKINIPESFAIFQQVKEKKEVIAYRCSGEYCCIIVAKEGNLCSQIIKPKDKLKESLDLLKKEFSLKSPDIIEVNNLPSTISVKDIVYFFSFPKPSFSEKLINTFDILKLPLILFLSFQCLYPIFKFYYINHLLQVNMDKLKAIENKTAELKEKYQHLEYAANFWKNFNLKENLLPDKLIIIDSIAKQVLKLGGEIQSITAQGYSIKTTISGIASDTLIKNLLNTGLFKEVKVISSLKNKASSKEISRIELIIKGVTNE